MFIQDGIYRSVKLKPSVTLPIAEGTVLTAAGTLANADGSDAFGIVPENIYNMPPAKMIRVAVAGTIDLHDPKNAGVSITKTLQMALTGINFIPEPQPDSELPVVSASDNGKVLVVEDGEWAAGDSTVIGNAVSDWLDDHPEATTTVEDGAVTNAKLAQTGGILSEVQDVRTGVDGTAYASAGEAVRSQIGKLTPTIIKIKDKLYSTKGGIYTSTKVHRNSDVMRRTTPIFVKAGQTVGAYLSGTRAYLVIAVYSSSTISENAYIGGCVGKASTDMNYYTYKAAQDCYVVFSTIYELLDRACAFILDEYLDGDKVLSTNIDRTGNTIVAENKVLEPMVIYNKTINASGAISSKSDDVISNKIKCSDGHVTVRAWGVTWLSVNFYDSSDAFLHRYEFLNEITDKELFVVIPFANTADYALICASVSSGDFKLLAFDGACISTDYKEAVLKTQNAFIDTAAHRGWTFHYPENTLIATKMAKKHCFKSVENDVRYTSDNVAVLLHDESINRTARDSNGDELSTTINIEDITYEEAMEYDFGVYAGAEFEGTKICTLGDQIALCKKLGLGMWIDVKVGGHASDVVQLVRKNGMEDHVVYVAFSSTTLAQILSIEPNATVMLARSSYSAEYLAELQELETSTNKVFAYLDYSNITSDHIAALLENGFPLALYSVDVYGSILNVNPYAQKICSTFYPADICITEETIG